MLLSVFSILFTTSIRFYYPNFVPLYYRGKLGLMTEVRRSQAFWIWKNSGNPDNLKLYSSTLTDKLVVDLRLYLVVLHSHLEIL